MHIVYIHTYYKTLVEDLKSMNDRVELVNQRLMNIEYEKVGQTISGKRNIQPITNWKRVPA